MNLVSVLMVIGGIGFVYIAFLRFFPGVAGDSPSCDSTGWVTSEIEKSTVRIAWETYHIEPDLNNSWEVTKISDPVAFLRFVISFADESDRWLCSEFMDSASPRFLDEMDEFISNDHIVVPLTSKNTERLSLLLGQLDFGSPPFFQQISNGTDVLLDSWDWLSICWVTHRMPDDVIRLAAQKYGFTCNNPCDDITSCPP